MKAFPPGLRELRKVVKNSSLLESVSKIWSPLVIAKWQLGPSAFYFPIPLRKDSPRKRSQSTGREERERRSYKKNFTSISNTRPQWLGRVRRNWNNSWNHFGQEKKKDSPKGHTRMEGGFAANSLTPITLRTHSGCMKDCSLYEMLYEDTFVYISRPQPLNWLRLWSYTMAIMTEFSNKFMPAV